MKKITLTIIGLLLVAGVSGGGVYYWQQNKWQQEEKNLQDQIKNLKAGLSSIDKNNGEGGEKTQEKLDCGMAEQYASEKLGIAFCYPKMLGDREVRIIEEEGKIYVDGKNGQYVETFNKSAKDSLTQAIEKEFLSGISKDKCWAEMATSENLSPSLFKNLDHVYARPIEYEADMSIGLPNNKECPQPYSKTNGINYFMMDRNHADRFFFFSIGQYGIPLNPDDMENSKMWQETVVVY